MTNTSDQRWHLWVGPYGAHADGPQTRAEGVKVVPELVLKEIAREIEGDSDWTADRWWKAAENAFQIIQDTVGDEWRRW